MERAHESELIATEDVQLVPVADLPAKFRVLYPDYACFNRVQSTVYPKLLHSDDSLVVTAPTATGKTLIFELAIVKLLMNCDAASKPYDSVRIVYVCPLKALCDERTIDWNKRLEPLGLTVTMVTGDSVNVHIPQLETYNIIVTTPEKWDSLTRSWHNNAEFFDSIALMLIDEVHLLADTGRGAKLEVVVGRMKTQQCAANRIRFVAASASVPNPGDVADWLAINGRPTAFVKFTDDVRPVELRKIVLSYPAHKNSDYHFDINLNYKLHPLILRHAAGKPTLIFCSSRRSAEMAAKQLVEALSAQLTPDQKAVLVAAADGMGTSMWGDFLRHGVGLHHAGIPPDARRTLEGLFRASHLPIMVTTTSLSMGVNLPAHLVIIKNTKCYFNNTERNYTDAHVLQMIGRAGRPQFGAEGVVIIMTTQADRDKYARLMECTDAVESCLHLQLIDHLNAEIALRNITNTGVAMRWLHSSYLIIRARKNPTFYGLPADASAERIRAMLFERYELEMKRLQRHGMIAMTDAGVMRPLYVGETMAKFYVCFETMSSFTKVSDKAGMVELLTVISQAKEFGNVPLRFGEKGPLNALNIGGRQESVRFPDGRIQTSAMKIKCLLQAVLGCLCINEGSLISEAQRILKPAQSLTRCLREYVENTRKGYALTLAAITLQKCLHCKLWENSSYVARQLNCVGVVRARYLRAQGKCSFQDLLHTNPRALDSIARRRVGDEIVQVVRYLPHYFVQLEERQKDSQSSTVRITIRLFNHEALKQTMSVDPDVPMVLLVGHVEKNRILLKKLIKHTFLIEQPCCTIDVAAEFQNTERATVWCHFLCDEWVGMDCAKKIILFPRVGVEQGESVVAGAKKMQTSIDKYFPKVKNSSAKQMVMEHCENECASADAIETLMPNDIELSTPSAVHIEPLETAPNPFQDDSIPDEAFLSIDLDAGSGEPGEESNLTEAAAADHTGTKTTTTTTITTTTTTTTTITTTTITTTTASAAFVTRKRVAHLDSVCNLDNSTSDRTRFCTFDIFDLYGMPRDKRKRNGDKPTRKTRADTADEPAEQQQEPPQPPSPPAPPQQLQLGEESATGNVSNAISAPSATTTAAVPAFRTTDSPDPLLIKHSSHAAAMGSPDCLDWQGHFGNVKKVSQVLNDYANEEVRLGFNLFLGVPPRCPLGYSCEALGVHGTICAFSSCETNNPSVRNLEGLRLCKVPPFFLACHIICTLPIQKYGDMYLSTRPKFCWDRIPAPVPVPENSLDKSDFDAPNFQDKQTGAQGKYSRKDQYIPETPIPEFDAREEEMLLKACGCKYEADDTTIPISFMDFMDQFEFDEVCEKIAEYSDLNVEAPEFKVRTSCAPQQQDDEDEYADPYSPYKETIWTHDADWQNLTAKTPTYEFDEETLTCTRALSSGSMYATSPGDAKQPLYPYGNGEEQCNSDEDDGWPSWRRSQRGASQPRKAEPEVGSNHEQPAFVFLFKPHDMPPEVFFQPQPPPPPPQQQQQQQQQQASPPPREQPHPQAQAFIPNMHPPAQMPQQPKPVWAGQYFQAPTMSSPANVVPQNPCTPPGFAPMQMPMRPPPGYYFQPAFTPSHPNFVYPPPQQQQMPGMIPPQQQQMPGMMPPQQQQMPGNPGMMTPQQQQMPGNPGMMTPQQQQLPGNPGMMTPQQQQMPGNPGMMTPQQQQMPGMMPPFGPTSPRQAQPRPPSPRAQPPPFHQAQVSFFGPPNACTPAPYGYAYPPPPPANPMVAQMQQGQPIYYQQGPHMNPYVFNEQQRPQNMPSPMHHQQHNHHGSNKHFYGNPLYRRNLRGQFYPVNPHQRMGPRSPPPQPLPQQSPPPPPPPLSCEGSPNEAGVPPPQCGFVPMMQNWPEMPTRQQPQQQLHHQYQLRPHAPAFVPQNQAGKLSFAAVVQQSGSGAQHPPRLPAHVPAFVDTNRDLRMEFGQKVKHEPIPYAEYPPSNYQDYELFPPPGLRTTFAAEKKRAVDALVHTLPPREDDILVAAGDAPHVVSCGVVSSTTTLTVDESAAPPYANNDGGAAAGIADDASNIDAASAAAGKESASGSKPLNTCLSKGKKSKKTKKSLAWRSPLVHPEATESTSDQNEFNASETQSSESPYDSCYSTVMSPASVDQYELDDEQKFRELEASLLQMTEVYSDEYEEDPNDLSTSVPIEVIFLAC